jgi:hypothetical protein
MSKKKKKTKKAEMKEGPMVKQGDPGAVKS